MNHADVIRRWPSLTAFASDLSVEYGTAKAMRRRRSIPPKYWPLAVAGAAYRGIDGITAEALMAGAATGISRHELRPDVFGQPERASA